LPVFRLDILKLRLDYAFDPAIFAMEMLQPACQCHPWFLPTAAAIYPRNLLRQGFLDKLLERVALPGGSGFCFAEEGLRNFECRFHKRLSPIFMGAVKTALVAFFAVSASFFGRFCLEVCRNGSGRILPSLRFLV